MIINIINAATIFLFHWLKFEVKDS